ncbi:MAG: hypothetical protein HYZ44_06195 [Bacteroidetes bacterium]|nr:hypothetical protein [Bacteroidota bacterium]
MVSLRKIICLGSDLDGVINPLNQFRTATNYQRLANALLLHVQDYWSSGSSKIPKGHLNLDAHNVEYQIIAMRCILLGRIIGRK